MKNLFATSVFALCGFVAGTACALYISRGVAEQLWRDELKSRDSSQFEAQNIAALRLHNIESAQRGDTDVIIRSNCFMLKLDLQHLRPEAFGPAREHEVQQFLERAQATVAALDGKALCGFNSKPATQ